MANQSNLETAAYNKSLDRSGGCVFCIIIDPGGGFKGSDPFVLFFARPRSSAGTSNQQTLAAGRDGLIFRFCAGFAMASSN